MLNKKFGGDLNKIKIVGQYFIEIWRACGVDMNNVEFIWASDNIKDNASKYMEIMLDIGSTFTVSDTMHCCTIMGRKEGETLHTAQLNYVQLQCADIFLIKGGVDICQMGLDQRKVNMLAREYYLNMSNRDVKPSWFTSRATSPIIISHKMIMSLDGPGEKMSKSKPETAIFVDDTEEEVNTKIKKAFCPLKTVFNDKKEIINPVIEYFKFIVLQYVPEVEILGVKYKTLEEIITDYESDKIGPKELKNSLAKYLNMLLEPIRKHFTQKENLDLIKKVKEFRTTR
jgi:tyrosyl-tRNA synthetase